MDKSVMEFPKRLFTKGLEPVPGKSIGHYSGDTKLFYALCDKLNPAELEHLRDSRLGVFLQFHSLGFGWASRVVQYMLGFQLQCKKKYELWFLIGVNPLRFSLHEFEHITGLACDYVENLDDPGVAITEDVMDFWELLGVHYELGPSIEDVIAALGNCAAWSPQDRLRLGYLAIYVGYIEAKRTTTKTPVNLARLVMDLERFESYPWGRVAFRNLVQSVKVKDLDKTIHIEGFVQVLQVWAYFALPNFGAEYGKPITSHPDNPPRTLLAYEGCRGKKFVKDALTRQSIFHNCVATEDYDDMFPQWDDDDDDEKVDNIIGVLHGRKWKWNKSHWSNDGVLVASRVTAKTTDEKSEGRPSKKSRVDTSDGNIGVDQLKTHMDRCFEALSSQMMAGFEQCEKKVKDLAEKVASYKCDIDAEKVTAAKSDMERSLPVQKEDDQAEEVAAAKSDMDPVHPVEEDADEDEKVAAATSGLEALKAEVQKDLDIDEHVNPVEEAAVGQERPSSVGQPILSQSFNDDKDPDITLIDAREASSIDFDRLICEKQQKAKEVAEGVARAKSARQRKLAMSQLSPFEGNSTAKRCIPNMNLGQGYDPFAPVVTSKLKTLVDWLKLDPNYKNEKAPPGSSLEWFRVLQTPQIWLFDTHIDAGISLLRLRYQNHPEWFRNSRICFVDSIFSLLWAAKYAEFVASPANADGTGKRLPGGAYTLYTGEHPSFCRSNKTWGYDIDDIYTCLNINKNHWLALWISIPNRHIVVWDSRARHVKPEEVAQYVEPLAVMIPYVLHELVPREDRHMFPATEYTCERAVNKVPINLQSGDCGVYALKYLECHALGMPFPEYFCDANIKAIRDKLAAEIYDEIKFTGQEKRDFTDMDIYE